MKIAVLALCVVTAAAAACGGDSQSATAPAATTSSASFETFSGILPVQGSSFYSFTITAAQTVGLSLVSLGANSVGPASASVVRLGLGVPVGTGCSVTNSMDTAAGLTNQLTAPVNPDVYCVNISDIGNLTGPMNFVVRIDENVVGSSSSATTANATFASFLSVGGWTAHTFPVSQAGTISITLTSVTPSSSVGLGIGIPGASGTCTLSTSLDATGGSDPQITVPVDAGTYCVEVFDDGGVTSPGVAFSVTIAHP